MSKEILMNSDSRGADLATLHPILNGQPQDVRVTVETITPAIAKEWLGNNTHNRTLRQSTILRYARDMAAGNWPLNGDSIKFAKSGVLLDGQHRLRAMLMAGGSIQSLVIRGLPEEAQDTIDQGARRTTGDVLQLAGEQNATVLASGLTWLYKFTWQRMTGAVRPTSSEIRDTLDSHPEIRKYLRHGRELYVSELAVPYGLALMLEYVLHSIDYDAASLFHEYVTSGSSLNPGDPVLALRRNLLKYRARAGRAAAAGRPHYYLAALVFKTWESWLNDERRTVLSWRATEPFPYPKGFPDYEVEG